MTESDWDDWNQYWGGCPPQGPLLRESHRDRWLRIHSLPGGTRYATSAGEWDELKVRHDAVAAAVLEVAAPCLFVRWSWQDVDGLDRGWRRVPRHEDWSDDLVPPWFFVPPGADLFSTSLVQRRALAERFADWRPDNPSGL